VLERRSRLPANPFSLRQRSLHPWSLAMRFRRGLQGWLRRKGMRWNVQKLYGGRGMRSFFIRIFETIRLVHLYLGVVQRRFMHSSQSDLRRSLRLSRQLGRAVLRLEVRRERVQVFEAAEMHLQKLEVNLISSQRLPKCS